MSTNDYLAGLDFAQLCYARDRANEMIKAKEEEAKVLLWNVSDRYINIGYHKDYLDAVEQLYTEAKIRATDSKRYDNGDRSLQVYPIRVRESEVDGYLGL